MLSTSKQVIISVRPYWYTTSVKQNGGPILCSVILRILFVHAITELVMNTVKLNF